MSSKTYLAQNVYEAAKERLEIVFDRFDKISVSFSGGKDSTVLFWMAYQIAQERGVPLHVLFIDLEGQYTMTIKFVEEIISRPGIIPYWVCLPLNLRNATSMFEPYWCCWEPEARDYWVRKMPTHPAVIDDQAYFPFYYYRMEFEEFTPKFAHWLAGDGETTAILVGIRSDESLNRYRTVKKSRKSQYKIGQRRLKWSTRIDVKGSGNQNVYNFYPIYDWRVEDIWGFHGKTGLPYNRLYDMMHLVGMSIHEMRICQPYGDDQRKGLAQFHQIEPETWFRILQRVSGANYGARYSGQKMLGYHGGLGVPQGHTWESYGRLLLKTLPSATRDHYIERINAYFKWRAIYCGEKTRIRTRIPEDRFDEIGLYHSEKIPYDGYKGEEAPDTEDWRAPLWSLIVKTLLKNDFTCKKIGFSQTLRQAEKYANLKRKYADI